jgi:hypothetical protein
LLLFVIADALFYLRGDINNSPGGLFLPQEFVRAGSRIRVRIFLENAGVSDGWIEVSLDCWAATLSYSVEIEVIQGPCKRPFLQANLISPTTV